MTDGLAKFYTAACWMVRRTPEEESKSTRRTVRHSEDYDDESFRFGEFERIIDRSAK